VPFHSASDEPEKTKREREREREGGREGAGERKVTGNIGALGKNS
jgi:hypothetical protein